MSEDSQFRNDIDDALDRMKRASERGTGCHLTKEMIDALSCSIIGQIWHEERQREGNDQ